MSARAAATLSVFAALALAAGCARTSDPTAVDVDGGADAGFSPDDEDAVRTYCAAAGACHLGNFAYGDFGACVSGVVLEAIAHTQGAERAKLVACANATPGDCGAITACYAGAFVERELCATEVYATFCEGDVLVSCASNGGAGGAGGTPTSATAARTRDCAATWADGSSTNGGPRCVDLTPDAGGASHRAACGVGTCDGRASGFTCKPGDVLLRCDYSGLLTAERCADEGSTCPTSSYGYGSCVSRAQTCDAGYSAPRCEGSRLVQRCGDEVVSDVDCAARAGWSCTETPYGYPSNAQCMPLATECYPTDGASCSGDKISYCEDGRRIGFLCSAKGFSGCGTSPYASGVRCLP